MYNCVNGNLIGKLSIGQGERGKSIEYMWRGTELGIRQEGETEYQFVDLAGGGVSTNGREVELQVGNGYIQWRYKGDAEWKNLIAIADLKGEQGIQGVPGVNGNDGRDGENGKSLEFEWKGTELGIKREDSQEFQYTNLKGADGVDGVDGTDGKDGKDGITPNLTVGNVETLEPTSDVTVTIGGTKENPTLNFGIPKGERGKDGIVGKDGKSLEFNWNDTSLGIRKEGDSDYKYVNLEGKQGQPGIAGTNGQDGTNGENGKSLEYNWNGTQLGVKREDENSYNYVDLKGRDGQEGQKGADGKDGITPNIQIGTVSTLEPGTNATVTRSGDNENPVFNFGIPRGEKGENGTGGSKNNNSFVKVVDFTNFSNRVFYPSSYDADTGTFVCENHGIPLSSVINVIFKPRSSHITLDDLKTASIRLYNKENIQIRVIDKNSFKLSYKYTQNNIITGELGVDINNLVLEEPINHYTFESLGNKVTDLKIVLSTLTQKTNPYITNNTLKWLKGANNGVYNFTNGIYPFPIMQPNSTNSLYGEVYLEILLRLSDDNKTLHCYRTGCAAWLENGNIKNAISSGFGIFHPSKENDVISLNTITFNVNFYRGSRIQIFALEGED